MRYLNAADNYYETNGADMNRYQAWHNQNDRFRPVYKNYCAVFGEAPAQFQYNVISTLEHVVLLPDRARVQGLGAWRKPASSSRSGGTGRPKITAYLKVKRDLFDCPGEAAIDGSAHIIKDRGFLFLFAVGKQPARASIPLNRWLGLDEDSQALYQVKEIYPRDGADLGVYRYGEILKYDVPRDSAVVLWMSPARPERRRGGRIRLLRRIR